MRVQFTLDELIACAERELVLRKNIYPRRIEAQKMKLADARKEYLLMKAIVANLKRQRR